MPTRFALAVLTLIAFAAGCSSTETTPAPSVGDPCGSKCGKTELCIAGMCRDGCYGDTDCPSKLYRCNASTQCLPPPDACKDAGCDASTVCYGYCE